MFVVLELFTNLVLETVLYAGAAGVSQVALLMSVAFWTWLWGPLGLLMATPLTVCLVVLGKHVPGLEFVGTLMADTPALAPEHGYYQRLLARDQSEAADLIERYIKTESPRSVYDALSAAGAELRGARSPGAAAVAGRRDGRHRCDAGIAVGRGGVDPAPASGADRRPRRSITAAGPREPLRRARLREQRRRRRARARDARPRCWTICPSSSRSPGRGCMASRPRVARAESAESPSSASPICRPALPRRPAISSRGSAPRFRSCASWWGAGGRRRWRTTARRRCAMPARISWPRRCARRGRTSAASRRFRESRFRKLPVRMRPSWTRRFLSLPL